MGNWQGGYRLLSAVIIITLEDIAMVLTSSSYEGRNTCNILGERHNWNIHLGGLKTIMFNWALERYVS